MRVTPADRWLIIGVTGSGKSTFANHLARGWRRVLAFDPNHDPADVLPGSHLATDVDDALAHLPGRVTWWPSPAEHDDLAGYLDLLVERVVRTARRGAGHGLLIHELAAVAPVDRRARRWLRFAASAGRHRDVPIIACTQRPRGLDRDVVTQFRHRVLFALDDPDDFTFAGRLLALDQRQRLLAPPPYHFYLRGPSGPARLIAPLPPPSTTTHGDARSNVEAGPRHDQRQPGRRRPPGRRFLRGGLRAQQ